MPCATAETAPLTTRPGLDESRAAAAGQGRAALPLADYAATLTLTPRTPLVSARSITNVKITPRSIEETLLIDFQIEQAGIRRVSFLVPQHLAKARLKAQLLKQKTIETATARPASRSRAWSASGWSCRTMSAANIRVLLEHDRLLAAGKQRSTLPVIETGRTDRRLVAIENAGRDEVVIGDGDAAGLEPINRQQQAWRDLSAVLGDERHAGLCRRSTAPATAEPVVRHGASGKQAERPTPASAWRRRCWWSMPPARTGPWCSTA